MVLQHVADRARLIVKRAAPLDAKTLRHRDLHTLDVLTVPDRLDKGVAETEEDQILHRVLAQIVVDAKYIALIEGPVHDLVQRDRRFQVVAKGLFDHHPCAVRASGLLQLLQHLAEETRRDRQVVDRVACAPALLSHLLESRAVQVVAVHVAQ